MKNNQPVTQRNVDYPADMMMVTTTDTKGIITYANPDFVKISGFSRDELMGKSHNVVRHPDMPPAAFADLWTTIKSGKPWQKLVKNRCKNGDHYWVDAYVTPILDNQKQIIGYQSVRSKPSTAQISEAEKLYADLNRNPGKAVPKRKKSIQDLSIRILMLIGLVIPFLLHLFTTLWETFDKPSLTLSLLTSGAQLALMILIYSLVIKYLVRPMEFVDRTLQAMARGQLRQDIKLTGDNEVGDLIESTKSLQSRFSVVLGDFSWSFNTLSGVASKLSDSSAQSVSGLNYQTQQTDQVAAAMNEMTATVHEVAQSAAHTAAAVQNAGEEAKAGNEQVSSTFQSIEQLGGRLNETAQAIEQLREKGNAIENVVQLISGVAEQTNLLALNAAIEAARAGEHGRGFAVVADEVRALAAKTQVSTIDIRNMIEDLRKSISDAVDSVQLGHAQMDLVRHQAGKTADSLNEISLAIDEIGNMSMQIATATEEQSAVAEEMNRNLTEITAQTEQAVNNSKVVADLGEEMAEMSHHLQVIVADYDLGRRQ